MLLQMDDRSIDLGSVRFTERYLKSDPVIDEEFNICLNEIDNKLEELVDWRSSIQSNMQMLAVAGTATTLASWHLKLKEFDAAEIEKAQLTSADLLRMVKELKRMTVKERCDQTGIDPKRADVLAGRGNDYVEDNGEIGLSSMQNKLKGFEVWGVNGIVI